jgi:predicted DNA-binding protein (MmcQ/YjbR family)
LELDADLLNRLRVICLRFPQAVETGGVGSPSFKVREKIFAMQHPMDGRPSLWFKAPRGMQGVLDGAAPERFFVPPYVGHHGWIGRWLDVAPDWEELADLVGDSYRMTAPRRLIRVLDQTSGDSRMSP